MPRSGRIGVIRTHAQAAQPASMGRTDGDPPVAARATDRQRFSHTPILPLLFSCIFFVCQCWWGKGILPVCSGQLMSPRYLRLVYRLPLVRERANQTSGSTVSLPRADTERWGRERSPPSTFRTSVEGNTVGLPSTTHDRTGQSDVRVYSQSTTGRHRKVGRERSPPSTFRTSVEGNTVGLPSTNHDRTGQSSVRVYSQSTTGRHRKVGRERSPPSTFRTSVEGNTVGLPSTTHDRTGQSDVRVYSQSTTGRHRKVEGSKNPLVLRPAL